MGKDLNKEVDLKQFSETKSSFWNLKIGQDVKYKTSNNQIISAKVLGFSVYNQIGRIIIGRIVLLELSKNEVVEIDALTHGDDVFRSATRDSLSKLEKAVQALLENIQAEAPTIILVEKHISNIRKILEVETKKREAKELLEYQTKILI
jgi:hypothetical protein